MIAVFVLACTQDPGLQQENRAEINAEIDKEVCHTTPSREKLAKEVYVDSNSAVSTEVGSNGSTSGMALIKGGTFQMGSEQGMPYEAPVHEVAVKSFYMDISEVTVGDFAKFVKATNYITEAEKFGSSGVFDVDAEQWMMKSNASWKQPEGKGSAAVSNEPVCQISWNDAVAYAKWAGKRLPTEAEGE